MITQHTELSKAKILLVTGIHQEELVFGDRIVSLLKDFQMDFMRIPEGISHSMKDADDQFYYKTRHREIYLQLSQQVNESHQLVIDLHSGMNNPGHSADIYCGNEQALSWLAKHAQDAIARKQLRLVKILNKSGINRQKSLKADELVAYTIIPEEVWNNPHFIYVGLEIYLEDEAYGMEKDWDLTISLIELLQSYTESL